jgi:hypothetical protein
MFDGDPRRTNLAALRRVLKVNSTNTVMRRRTLADCATAAGHYPFE